MLDQILGCIYIMAGTALLTIPVREVWVDYTALAEKRAHKRRIKACLKFNAGRG